MTRSIQLTGVGMPPLDIPETLPAVAAAEFEERIAALLAAVDVDHVVVYGDREHAASLVFLCNLDPRFEEVLLVLGRGRRTLLLGKEDIGYIPRGFVVRASADPIGLTASIRAIVRRIDPMLPVSDVRTLADIVEDDTASRSAQLRVIAAFAVIAFVLAGIGIHGLLSFAVSQRTQEIGVRIALGAQPGDILSMVLRRIVLLVAAGVIPGVALAYAAGRWMEALLAGVRPADATTLAAAVGLSIATAIAGSVMPTLRALRVDPLTAIRTE